jgi:alginate O-acetyltransferase complex protein AlgI
LEADDGGEKPDQLPAVHHVLPANDRGADHPSEELPVYAHPDQYSTSAVWIALIAYSLQIYCDFSGYSDIAIGTAHMLGFKLPENFNMPYMSRNIAEFWRRWHISLSTWLRDYVFLTLGGGKRSQAKMSTNMLITMTLCGLWHGANWTFVLFGVLQGLMLLGHHRFRDFSRRRKGLKKFLETIPGITSRILLTYVLVSVLPGVLFRAQSFHTVGEILKRAFIPHSGIMVRDPVGPWSLVFAFTLVAVCHVTVESGLWKRMAPRITPPMWGLAYVILMALTFIWVPESREAFIYFQF